VKIALNLLSCAVCHALHQARMGPNEHAPGLVTTA
jgi:hypothetical protein